MKKFWLIGISAISTLNINNALASGAKVFVGGNMAVNGVAWSNETDDATKDIGIELPTSFFGIGFEAGILSTDDRVYNAGLTIAYDYAFDSEAELDTYIRQYYYDASIGFSAISATYDSYLRVSGNAVHHQDIVLGIGFSRATERVKATSTYYGDTYGLGHIDESDDGTTLVLKVGYNFRISEHTDWYLNGRWFVPFDSDSDADALFNANVGLRFLF